MACCGAGVSAFGVGGTNAHVVLEEAPASAATDRGQEWQLLPLSARTENALHEMEGNLGGPSAEASEQELADVAYTLQLGRQRFSQRRTVVCHTVEQAIAILEQPEDLQEEDRGAEEVGPKWCGCSRGRERSRPPWQGVVRAGAGLPPADRPVFGVLRPHLGLELSALIRGESTQAEEIDQTWLAQPWLFAMEYGLAQLWMSWGVKPQAMWDTVWVNTQPPVWLG